jgi:hypothetical protein
MARIKAKNCRTAQTHGDNNPSDWARGGFF